MADNTEVIRSFLVSVGVQSDEKGLKRFDDTTKRITKTVGEFAKALGAAAVAASAAISKVSEEFEDLYYASQKLHSSVENIKAFSFGMSQMGGNTKQAMAALEGFSSFMRSSPMSEGLIRSWGVQTRDAAGNLRDYSDLLNDLGDRFRQMPLWAAQQRAQMVGIDQDTLQVMLRDTTLWQKRMHDATAASGVDMKKLAEQSANFMQGVRMLRLQAELFAYKLMQNVNPAVLRLSVVVGAVAAAFGAVAIIVGPVAAGILAVAGAIAILVNDYQTWRQGGDSLINWEKWSGEIEQAIGAFQNLGAAFAELGDALKPLEALFTRTFGPVVETAIRAFVNGAIDSLDLLAASLRIVAALLRGDTKGATAEAKKFADIGNRRLDRPLPPPVDTTLPPAANQNAPSTGSNAQRAYDYFKRQGYTHEQAMGIVAGMNAENGGLREGVSNPKSGAYGLGQWLGPRKAALFRRYGQNPTFDNQLEFLQSELMGGDPGGRKVRGQSTAAGVANSYITDFMRPAPGAETTGDLKRANNFLANTRLDGGGANTVTINAKTDIKVTGGDKETAQAVGVVVDDRNSQLVRNTRSAVR